MRRHCPFAASVTAALLTATLLPAAASAGEPAPDIRVVRRDAVRDVRGDVRVIDHDGDQTIVLGGRRGYLGVHVAEMTPELRRHFQADESAGVLVSKVEPNSPAAAAGVEVGDVLVAVDDEPVDASWELRRVVAPRRDGDVVGLDVVRNGRRLRLDATLQERQGRVMEFSGLLPRDGDGRPLVVLPEGAEWEQLAERFEHLGPEIGKAVEQALADPSVRMRIDEQSRDRERLERQIEVLERRLQELERRLEEQRR
jgi:hypothetical protein